MSRLGLKLASVFALVMAAAMIFVTAQGVRIIEGAQRFALQDAAQNQFLAVQRVIAEEAGGITARLTPLASVRELSFRVQPVLRPSLSSLVVRSDTATAALDSGMVSPESLADTGAEPAPDNVTGPVDPVGLQRFVEQILPVTGLDAIEVTTLDGEVMARGHYPESFGERREDYVLADIAAGGVVTGFRFEPFRDQARPVLYVAVPILAAGDSASSPVAALTGGVRLDRLAERLGRLSGSIVQIALRDVKVSSIGNVQLPDGDGLISAGSDWFWAFSAPLEVNSAKIGGLRIMVPATETVNAQRRLAREMMWLGAVATVLAALSGIALGLLLTRRLARLNLAAERISRGDLVTPVAVRGRDEIGVLGETVSTMAIALREERERLSRTERVAAWRDAARRLAHELKNAITPVNLSLRTVQRALAKGEPGRAVAGEALDAIASELEQLRSLVEQFSQFARLPAPRLAPYDLVRALRSAAALHSGSGVEFRYRLPDALVPVLADEELMSRVWANLLSNAIAAAGPSGWVEIAAAPAAAGGVAVAITDSGSGLARDRLNGNAKEGESTKTGGWGLGLALAERIAVEHGGTLAMENSEQAGARITVTLPVGSEPSA